MAESYQRVGGRESGMGIWYGVGAAGLAAGFVMGLLMHFVMGVMPMVGALYGQPTVVAGWIAHLFHSVVFALLFAGAVSHRSTSRYTRSLASIVGLGAAYGIVTWFVAAGIVMPAWLGAIGLAAPGIPNLNPMSLLAHLLFGVVLAAVCYAVWPASAEATAHEVASD